MTENWHTIKPWLEKRCKWLVVLLLLLFWWRLLDTAVQKSVTFDEVLHVFQGALYWQKAELFSVVQNPPLVNAVIGIPVSMIARPAFPEFEPISDWLKVSKSFMWDLNANGLQMIFAGRLAIMSLALCLGALIFHWSRTLFRSPLAGLLTLILFTFDPNVLAHSFIASTDLGTAFFMVLAAFCVWQFWQRPSFHWGWYVAAGLGLGLAFAAKFSGVILVPAIVIMAVYRLIVLHKRGRDWALTAVEIFGWVVIAFLLFFLIYRFNFETFWLDFSWQQQHQARGHQSFLLGEFSRGTPLYFPITFALKTPLSLLFLLGCGLLLFVLRRRFDWEPLWPLLIAGGIGAAALVSRVNIGYRYLLSALPFLYIFLGQLGQPGFVRQRTLRWAVGISLLLFMGGSLLAHPHYLAFFNTIAGGPENGWRLLADSNIDWGQDLQELAEYVAEQNIQELKANLMSSATLAAYDIPGEMLLGSPAAKDADDLLFYDWFYPENPAPGTYALSVTQLHGIYLKSSRDRFQWFKEREPIAKVGYSIFVYEVPAEGVSTGLGLSGLRIATIDPEDYKNVLQSNDVHPRWFDARTGFLWPGGGEEAVWTVIGDAHLPTNLLLQDFYANNGEVLSGERLVEDTLWQYQIYDWPESPIRQRLQDASEATTIITDFGWASEPVVGAAEWAEKRRPLATAVFSDTLELSGLQMGELAAGQPLELLTFWRVRQPPTSDLKIFIHLLDEAGQVIAQHDGLDIHLKSLQPGDEFAQLHTILLPEALPAGTYALQTGVYETDSLTRLPLAVPEGQTDRVLLQTFALED